MKLGCMLFFLSCSALTVTTVAHAQTPDTTTTAPYLLAGALTFGLSVSQSRGDFNSQNPSLPLNKFRAINSSPDKASLTRVVSKVNESLCASITLEHDTLKIKSIQMTWLPIQGPEQKAAKAKAQEYMAAVIRTPIPLMTKTQNRKKLQSLLMAGRGERHYTKTESALRYVVTDNGERGSAFAVKPIKLALPESPEGLNK